MMNFQTTSIVEPERCRILPGPTAVSSDSIIVGDLKLDARRFRVWQGETEITLTSTGFKILQVLMADPGFVMTRDELLDRVWGVDTDVSHRTVDTAVKRLRDCFLPNPICNPIRTVRGMGYAFDETYSSSRKT